MKKMKESGRTPVEKKNRFIELSMSRNNKKVYELKIIIYVLCCPFETE